MSVRAVFVISNQGLDLWLVGGLAPARHVAFFADPERDADALAALARRVSHLRVQVLADLVEEDFRVEKVARLHGRDHRALVERHLKREFRDTPYRMLCSRFRDPEDRHRETLVLSGIIAPAQVDRWLQPLVQAGCRITGVHSASVLCQRLFSRLPPHWRHGTRLLATLNRHGGLRISLFDQGKLRFSRMSLHDPQEISLRDFLNQELRRSRRFYENLRLVARGGTLQCLFAAADDEGIESGEVDDGLSLEVQSEFSIGLLVRRRQLEGLHADALLAELLVRMPPRRAYASEDQKRVHRHQQLTRAAWHVATGSVVASLAYAGLVAMDMKSLGETQKALQEARSLLAAQLDSTEAQAPQFPAPVQLMETAVDTAAAIHARRGVVTLQVLGRVGHVLELYPAFRLKALGWRNAGKGGTASDDAQDNNLSGLLPESVSQSGLSSADLLVLKGSYPVDPRNLAETASRLKRLLAALESVQGVSGIEIVENPLDPADTQVVFGQIGPESAGSTSAPLGLILRLENS